LALIDNIKIICTRLAPHGWKELFAAHGLDISANDLATELNRKLEKNGKTTINRNLKGFEDFSEEGFRGIEPGIPSRSLLFHALASPNVVFDIKGDELSAFPTLSQIETIENYIYATKNFALPQNQDELKELSIVVFATEYRTGSETVHKKHADMCFSRTGIARVGTEILRTEIKEPLETEEGKDKEHFGFRDGVSQPLIDGVSDESKKGQRFPPEDFVLTDQDPWINEGSFMVFRRLAQDVSNFKIFMKKTSAKLGMSEDKLGAKFMGRWKSGAPLALDEFQDKDPKKEDLTDFNDFTYMDDDPDGKKTPRFSHIRKTNPRGDGGFATKEENLKANNTHRMLRRGAPYGKEFDENDPKSADVERGLLFMCYVKNIPRQFEFVQRIWANEKDFPKAGTSKGNKVEHGHDPIIGQHDGEGFVHLKQGDSFTRIPKDGGFEQWVTMTGGEYFFSPSIKALQSL